MEKSCKGEHHWIYDYKSCCHVLRCKVCDKGCRAYYIHPDSKKQSLTFKDKVILVNRFGRPDRNGEYLMSV